MIAVGSYDKQGGTNTFVRNLSENLSKNEIFTLVMPHKLKGENFQNRDINKNLVVRYFPAFPRIRYFPPLYLLRFILMAILIVPIILKHKINIILTGETEALPFMIAKLFGIKVVIRGGNPFPAVTKVEYEKNTGKRGVFISKLIDIYEYIILRLASKIVILSEWEREILKNYTKKDFEIIRYAVNTDKFKDFKGKRAGLLYVGRISASKNIEKLIEIFDNIRSKKKCKLYLAGPLEDYDNFEELAKKSKFEKEIVYLGEKSATEIPSLLNTKEIFVHVAYDLGNAPLEAAASGLPVVVLGEKFDERYIIKCKNEKDYVKKVLELLNSKKKIEELKKNNFSYIMKNHSWKNITNKYIRLFSKL